MRRSSAIAPRSGRAATRMPCASDMPGSPRASEVLSLIVAGRLNKQIAGELATSERTVEFHRTTSWRRWRPTRSRSWCAWRHSSVSDRRAEQPRRQARAPVLRHRNLTCPERQLEHRVGPDCVRSMTKCRAGGPDRRSRRVNRRSWPSSTAMPSVRKSTTRLIRACGYRAEGFAPGKEDSELFGRERGASHRRDRAARRARSTRQQGPSPRRIGDRPLRLLAEAPSHAGSARVRARGHAGRS